MSLNMRCTCAADLGRRWPAQIAKYWAIQSKSLVASEFCVGFTSTEYAGYRKQ